MGRGKEEKGDFIFTSTEHGLRVLDTLPNSVGEKMGLKPGDIILSFNGHRIYSKQDIEDILFYRPKFIWLDVFDINKGLVTKEYKNYQKEIHSMGIIVVPNMPDEIFVIEESKTPFEKFMNGFKKKKSSFKN